MTAPAHPRPRLALVGAGTMAAVIAAGFAHAGWYVDVLVRSPTSQARFERRSNDALASLSAARDARLRIECHAGLDAVIRPDTALVLESITEDLTTKRALFAQLDSLAGPDVVLASNSSSHPISSIAGDLPGRARAIGMHFFMPAQLVPLVELIPSPHTAAWVLERASAWLHAAGKRPVHVRKEVMGFLANRMQAALMREALWLVEDGVATPADIDVAVRFGFGFRYAAAGPILQKEHSGWDTTCAVAKVVYPTLHNDDVPPPVLQRNVEAGCVGLETGEGFYRWDTETIAVERARYERALQRCLAIFREEASRDPAAGTSHQGT